MGNSNMSAPNDAVKRIADLRLLKLVVCNIATLPAEQGED